MERNGLIAIINRLQSSGFRDIAGTQIAASIPVSARLINELVAGTLPASAPVREVSIRPEAGNQFSVRITPRASLLPPLTLRLEIEQQPDLPAFPVLVMRMKTMGGLFGFASAALPIGNMLPPGVRLDGERILVDVGALAADRGFADLLAYVRRLTINSEDGRVIVYMEAST